MFAFLILLAIDAFLFVAGQLLAPTPKSPVKQADTGGVKPPGVSKGTPIALVYGTQRRGCNLVWYGNVRAQAIKQKVPKNIFSSTTVTTGYNYGFDFFGILCHGPIDALIDLCWEDKSTIQHGSQAGGQSLPIVGIPTSGPYANADGSVYLLVNDPKLFGGSTSEGGITNCGMDVFFGTATQTSSIRGSETIMMDVTQPDYPGLAYIVAQGGYFGNTPYPKDLTAVIKRCPKTLSVAAGHAAWADVNGDANIAEVIYDMLTGASGVPGFTGTLGLDTSNFDTASFQACAEQLYTDGIGVSFSLDQAQQDAETEITQLLSIADGVVFTHPETGLITMKLARFDYVLADCLVIDETNARELEYSESSWPETYNEVQVAYTNRGPDSTTPFATADAWPFQSDVITVDNLANQQAQGSTVAQQLSYPEISNATTATIVGQRALRIVSAPLAKANWKMNRTGHALTVGTVVLVNSTRYGIASLPMRITSLGYGKLEDGEITVNATEDVYATRASIYVPPTSTWVPPFLNAALPTVYAATEVPYFLNDDATQEKIRVMTMAVKSSSVELDYNVYSRLTVAGLTPSLTRALQPFSPGGVLTAAYPWSTDSTDTTVGFTIHGVQDMDELASTDGAGLARGDNLVLILSQHDGSPQLLEEIVSVETITDNGDGTWTCTGILRGQLDTVPRTHPIGAQVFFLTNGGQYGLTIDSYYSIPESVDVWFGPIGLLGIQDFSSGFGSPMATSDPTVTGGRATMPYAPAGLAINGSMWPAFPSTIATDATITWQARNRVTQTAMVDQNAGALTPEGNFEIRVYLGGVLARTDTASASPYVYTTVMHAADAIAVSKLTTDAVKFEVRGLNGSQYSAAAYAPGGVPGDADSLTLTMP